MFALICIGASAQSAKIYFKQAYSTYDPSYMDNGKILSGFIAECKKNQKASSENKPDTIYITSGTSPEGAKAFNRKLSDKRAATLRKQLQLDSFFANTVFVVDSKGIDWDGLIELVEEADDMPYQEEMLDILRNTPEMIFTDGKLTGGRKRSMECLKGGRPYWWMYDNLFPYLRASGYRIRYSGAKEKDAQLVEVKSSCLTDNAKCLAETQLEPAAAYVLPEVDPTVYNTHNILVKTNLLTDIVGIGGIGVEIPLKNRFSVGADWNYGWWTNHDKFWWRYYGGDLYFRKWFGGDTSKDAFSGHHVGLYGQILTYDFELGGRGYLAPKWSHAAGVEYGYSFPLKKGWHIECNVGVGAMWGTYMDYLPLWNEYPRELHYVWQHTYKSHYFGPTQAEISLVKTITWQSKSRRAAL